MSSSEQSGFKRRGRKIVFRLAAVFLSLLLLGVLAEISFRILHPRAPDIYRPSPILGWEHAPGVGPINSSGLNMDRELDPRSTARRILLIGDSFLDNYPFWKRLESALQKRSPDTSWEVVSSGVSGYALDQYYLWYAHYGRFLVPRPATVVVCVFLGNDWADMAKERTNGGIAKPYFLLQDTSLVLFNSPIAQPEIKTRDRWSPIVKGSMRKLLASRTEVAASSGGFIRRTLYPVHLFLRKHSRAYYHFKDLLAAALQSKGGITEEQRYAPADLFYFRNYSCLFSTKNGQDGERIWRLFEAVLNRMKSDVEAEGASFAILLIPHIWQVDTRAQKRFLSLAEREHLSVDLDAPLSRIEEMARRNHWRLVNLVSPFRERNATKPVYESRGPEAHWSEEGMKVAVENLLPVVGKL
ncbi:MAG: DUF459 domain-containing protein [Candidatus Hydrogenedentota bacterium]|nr:MAG: DUF459 domain-containing protein [Candidatus Hydrogenedentota bacterium]